MKKEAYLSARRLESGTCVSMNGHGDELLKLLAALNSGVADLMLKSGLNTLEVLEVLQAEARIGVRAAADENKRCM